MIRIPCPNCEATLKVADSSAGSRVTCPKCREKVRIPEVEDPDEEDEEPPEVLPAEAPPVRKRRPRDEEDRPRRRKRRRSQDEGSGLSVRNILFGGIIILLGLLQIIGGLTSETTGLKVAGPIVGLGFIAGGVLYAMRR